MEINQPTPSNSIDLAHRDYHDATEGFPPERWAHDARVAISDYLIRANTVGDEEMRVLMKSIAILKRKANNG